MRHRPLFLVTLLLAALAGGCMAPVSPLVNFTPYSNPFVTKENFETQFSAWKAGRQVTWTIHYKGSSFSEQELTINSDGTASLGGALPGSDQSFTVSKADLSKLVDTLIQSGMFGLYDGHYGAWTQGGGSGGPNIRVTIAGIEKRVSKDQSLDIGWEADAIQKASDAIASTALKYLR